MAQQKLFNSNAKIIAITGSNGKTSVKKILSKMLEKKYQVKCSPASYNTPLGIAKFINETEISTCNFLIFEYGARKKYDIKTLCRLFGADYGIITNVNPQHLESFKSIENVFETKSELSNFLSNKFCAYNIDDRYVKQMYETKANNKVAISINENTKVYAQNIYIENFKTHFEIKLRNKIYNTTTSLLGEHNIANILLSTALAIELQITNQQILETIKNLQPVEHRLQPIISDINILDDTYNCSIASAKMATKVFKFFPNKKMIVTPGIIEAGKNSYDINFKLGQFCTVANLCVIVGEENKKAISDGLKSLSFEISNILYAKDLEQAKLYFSKLNLNDSLLLLNDLPDDYK